MPKNSLLSLQSSLRFVLMMWFFFGLERILMLDLTFFGILPRKIEGLPGIFFAPFIHGNLTHLLSNTFPFMFLSGVLYLFYPKIANRTFLQCFLITGAMVWIFGRDFYHIGASGVVYSLAAFLIALGFLIKDIKTILISIVVLLLYGGLIYGILPTSLLISYESHLLGAIVGVGVAISTAKFSSKQVKN